MKHPSQPRAVSPWAWVGITALVIALLAVWGAVGLRDLGGGSQTDTGPTGHGSGPTQDPDGTGESTADPDLIELTEAAGFSAASAALRMDTAPEGFTVRESSEDVLLLEAAAGCTISLGGPQTDVTGPDDATATAVTIDTIIDTLTEINENLTVLRDPESHVLPVGEDGRGGAIEFTKFTVAYRSGVDGTATETHLLLRTFTDLELTLQLTYTCPQADDTVTFEAMLATADLWAHP